MEKKEGAGVDVTVFCTLRDANLLPFGFVHPLLTVAHKILAHQPAELREPPDSGGAFR